MMRNLVAITVFMALLLLTACGQAEDAMEHDAMEGDAMMEEGDAMESSDDSYEAGIEEVGDLDSEIVDPELDSELDGINLDDW